MDKGYTLSTNTKISILPNAKKHKLHTAQKCPNFTLEMISQTQKYSVTRYKEQLNMQKID